VVSPRGVNTSQAASGLYPYLPSEGGRRVPLAALQDSGGGRDRLKPAVACVGGAAQERGEPPAYITPASLV
jgi:hypothetical protein